MTHQVLYSSHLQKRYEAENRLRIFFNQQVESDTAFYRSRYDQLTVQKIVQCLSLCPDDRVLDLGCGDGWFCRILSPLCPEGSIVGLDISDSAVRRAREQSVPFENILYTPGTAEEIPWAEDYFARVVALESAYYWPSPEDAVQESFRVTKPGGEFFLLLSLCTENPYTHHCINGLDDLLQIKSTQEWREILTDSGFSRVESEQLAHPDVVLSSPPDNSTTPTPWLLPQALQESRDMGPLLLRGLKPILPQPGHTGTGSNSNPFYILE